MFENHFLAFMEYYLLYMLLLILCYLVHVAVQILSFLYLLEIICYRIDLILLQYQQSFCHSRIC